MRRLVFGLMAGVLLLTACSSDDPEGDAATTAVASTTSPQGEASDGQVYLVQEAGPSTLEPAADADDTYELTLIDAEPRTVVFTGQPDPEARTAPTGEAVAALDDSDAEHDAALTWSSRSGEGTVVVTLLSGTYDESSRTVTYRVRPVEPSATGSEAVAARAERLGATGGSTDELAASMPDDVAGSTLFVDPLGQDQAEANCQLTVVNETEWAGEVSKVDRADSGGMVDWDEPLTDGEALPAGGKLEAASGNSSWDCHANVGFSLTDSIGDEYGVFLTLRDPVFSKTTWSCVGPPELTCQVTANDTGQPMDMTVTISD